MKEKKNKKEIVEHKRGREREREVPEKKRREKAFCGLWSVTTIITQTSRTFYDSRCINSDGSLCFLDKYPNLFDVQITSSFLLNRRFLSKFL